ncbi:hypothetical protein [Kitasatospora sp. NPDC004531]
MSGVLSPERVRVVALRYRAGELVAGELPMAAAELVAEGYESAALYDLAGRGRRESASDLEPLLRQVLDEFGVAFPEAVDGERWLLHELAARLGEGRLTTGEFAEAVGRRELSCGEGRAEAVLFDALAPYCDCCIGQWTPEDLAAWEAEVRAAAAALAADGW